MSYLYRIGFLALLCLMGAFSGFFYGQKYQQAKIAQASITAYQNAGDIQNEINNLDDYALCLRAGGVSDNCKVLMRRLDKTTKNE